MPPSAAPSRIRTTIPARASTPGWRVTITYRGHRARRFSCCNPKKRCRPPVGIKLEQIAGDWSGSGRILERDWNGRP